MAVPYIFNTQTGPIPLSELDENFAYVSSNTPPYYERSEAEIVSGITPTNYTYPVLDVRRYGAVGDLVANDTVAINNACVVAAAQGGGDVWIDGSLRCLVNGNIVVGNRVVLKGPYERIGLPTPYTTDGLQKIGGAIWLSSSATIQLAPGTGYGTSQAGGSGVKGLYILRQGVTVATSAADADAVVAAFAGTAITVEGLTTNGDLVGIDCYIGHCFIGGFNQAIYAGISDRLVIEYVSGDNTNGIYLNNTYDLARIHHCHFWNFFTYYYLTDTTNAWRNGTAYYFDTGAEGNSVSDCFSYGHKVGFNVAGPSNVLVNCWADAAQYVPLSNSQSFNLSGNDIKLIGCQASSHQTGYYINGGGQMSLENCSSWGAPANCQYLIYVNEAGYLQIHGGQLWGSYGNSTMPSAAFIGMNSTGIITYSIDQVTFWGQGSGAAVPAFSFSGVSGNLGNIGVNNIYAGQVTGPSNTQDVRNAGSSLYPNAHDVFSYGASTGFVENFFQASGTPVSVGISPASAAIYQINAFGSTGSSFQPAASMRFIIDGTPSSTSMPGKIIFSTTPSGSTTSIDRAVFDNAGNFFPVTDNSSSLGVNGARWTAVWAVNGTIQTSDARQKTDVASSSLGLSFVNDLRPVSYKWIEGGKKVVRQVYKDKNGNEITDPKLIDKESVSEEIVTESILGKRTHWGLIAQEVKSVATKYGVDFGGHILTDINNPDSEQGLRYDQFIAPMIKAIQELSSKVSELEKQLVK